MQNEQLDQDAINLAKAIRQTESGGNFKAKGKSGEYGAYQYTPDTWKATSSKYGVNVPIEQATPEQQNEVTYRRIKEWKDSGRNVGQIASMWNAGEGEPDAYTGKFSNGKSAIGKNKYGVDYSVPKYAKSVATAYQTIKGGGQAQTDPNNPSYVNPNTQPAPLPETKATQPAKKKGLISKLESFGRPFADVAAIPVQYLGKKLGVDAFPDKAGVGGDYELSKIEDVGGKLKSAGKAALMTASAMGAGKIAGLIKGARMSPVVETVLQKAAGKESISALSNAEKVTALTRAIQRAEPVERIVLQQSLEKILPQAIKQAGGKVAFAQLYPKLSKLLGLSGGLLKGAKDIAIGGAAGYGSSLLFGNKDK